MIMNRVMEKKPAMQSDIVIVFPVFNDWQVAQLLLRSLDEVLSNSNLCADVLAVDDGSTVSFKEEIDFMREYRAIKQFSVLELGRNLGHQKAIAVALSYIEENILCDAVVVMDADGEDDPKYIPKLVEKLEEEKQQKVVFAQRTKRSESFVFKSFYQAYKHLFRLFTGSNIRVGNFCIIPQRVLSKVVLVSEVWNHFSAGILKAKLPFTAIPTTRAARLGGSSKMNFISLVMHGLSAISVNNDILGIRVLIGAALSTVVIITVLCVTLLLKSQSWLIILLFLLILFQVLLTSLFFIFSVLSGRNSMKFIPKRDFSLFVKEVHTIFSTNS